LFPPLLLSTTACDFSFLPSFLVPGECVVASVVFPDIVVSTYRVPSLSLLLVFQSRFPVVSFFFFLSGFSSFPFPPITFILLKVLGRNSFSSGPEPVISSFQNSVSSFKN